MSSNPQSEQQRCSPESQRPGPELSNLVTSQNRAGAPGYTKLGPPKNLLKPIQPSGSLNAITLPPLATDNSLDTDIECSGQAVSGQRWEVKPRPRPGRKLATDAPDTKRKQQNREAQRAFRERRAQRVSELEAELQKAKNEHRQALQLMWQTCENEKNEFMQKWRENFGSALEEDKVRMSEQLRRKDEDLMRKDTELHYWKDKASKAMGMDTQLTPPPYGTNLNHPFTNSSPASMVAPSTYPSMNTMGNMPPPQFPRSSFSDNSYSSANFRPSFPDPFNFRPSLPNPRTSQQVSRPTGAASASGFGVSSSAAIPQNCGNCTEDDCPCVDELVDDSNSNVVRHPSAANPPISPTDSRNFNPSGNLTDLSGREMDFTTTASRQTNEPCAEPGSCANCQANPDQKKFCEALHQEARHADQPRPRKESDSFTSQMLPPVGNGRMSCADTYSLLYPNRNFSMDSNYEFMKDLFAVPSSRKDSGLPGAPQRTALEVECAGVLDYMRSSGSISAPGHPQHPANYQAREQLQGDLDQDSGEQGLHAGDQDNN